MKTRLLLAAFGIFQTDKITGRKVRIIVSEPFGFYSSAGSNKLEGVIQSVRGTSPYDLVVRTNTFNFGDGDHSELVLRPRYSEEGDLRHLLQSGHLTANAFEVSGGSFLMIVRLELAELSRWRAPRGGSAVMLMILSLAACAPGGPYVAAPDEAAGSRPPPGTSPTTEAGCVAAGGEWRRAGRLGSWMCVTPYADAGRPCADGTECEGDCRLPPEHRPVEGRPVTGVCQADSAPFGCFTRVENGRATATLCVD